jgi:branched-chain amino acid transport system ATP-binding protein
MNAAQSLSCRDILVAFGGFRAVDGVSMDFVPGEINSVIGPNGAGKTTLMNVLSGRQTPQRGEVRLGDVDISRRTSHQRAQLGVGRSFQITKIFPEMTVFENFRLAAQARVFRLQPFWRPAASYDSLRDAAEEILEEVGMTARRDQLAEELSHGDQRALELGITLATRPRVLLLDEPLAGVGEKEMDQTVALIARVARGRTVVLVEHNIQAVMDLSHTVFVMNQGKLLASGSPAEMRVNKDVRTAYLGDDHAAA